MSLITRRVFLKFLSVMGLTGFLGGMVSCGSSGGGSEEESIASNFQIANGDPDPLISDSIWCKLQPEVPPSWLVSDDLPPGPFEDPVYRDDSWVWVKVHQAEELEASQETYLHLFAGMESRDYTLEQVLQPSNWFSPDVTWTSFDWETELATGKVVPIPWYNGLDTEPNCPIFLAVNQPGVGLGCWYQFKWDRNLIQPPWFCTNWDISLIACVDDSKSTQSGMSIKTNPASAQRYGSVL